MLTELDGAEGLSGVYVLAATSRPHMIDPALLRPGRLDKIILCDMPTSQERLEILQCASRTMNLSSMIDLETLGKQCDGYSGADLSSLLSNAQLAAIHDSIDDESLTTTRKTESNVPLFVVSGTPTQSELDIISSRVSI